MGEPVTPPPSTHGTCEEQRECTEGLKCLPCDLPPPPPPRRVEMRRRAEGGMRRAHALTFLLKLTCFCTWCVPSAGVVVGSPAAPMATYVALTSSQVVNWLLTFSVYAISSYALARGLEWLHAHYVRHYYPDRVLHEHMAVDEDGVVHTWRDLANGDVEVDGIVEGHEAPPRAYASTEIFSWGMNDDKTCDSIQK